MTVNGEVYIPMLKTMAKIPTNMDLFWVVWNTSKVIKTTTAMKMISIKRYKQILFCKKKRMGLLFTIWKIMVNICIYVCMYTYSLLVVREHKEDGYEDSLNDQANTIDGNDQKTVGMDNGETIEHPHGTVQDCCYIWIRLELFHGFQFNYFNKCGANCKRNKNTFSNQ